ncbi:MAG: hypothetical protein H6557_27775 [Lewinellaceae bacterium]|nr:hypothetical protein [Phaeodactylibacter sp.]MCB9040442.1 hypothetical protein [Lewinellaceae bacterium]
MKISPVLAFALLLTFSACRQETRKTPESAEPTGLALRTQASPELEYENLRLYPITADAAYIEKNAAAAEYKNLGEAIGNPRFRITEKKPFGRFEDQGAVNTLTVQNKSEDMVFLMAGDVIQGGKQDRVIAQDLVVPPRTITDLAVFCVEPHRWQAREQETPAAAEDPRQSEKNKRIYAFTGYYNVATNDIRRSATQSKNQQAVWDEVGKVTAVHNAQTSTGAYAALEQSESFTQARARYLSFFGDKFDRSEDVVGVVAVTGDEVIGMDIFAHPALFKKQYKALLHSYVTDALTGGAPASMEEAAMKRYEERAFRKFGEEDGLENEKYEFQGLMVHFVDL